MKRQDGQKGYNIKKIVGLIVIVLFFPITFTVQLGLFIEKNLSKFAEYLGICVIDGIDYWIDKFDKKEK